MNKVIPLKKRKTKKDRKKSTNPGRKRKIRSFLVQVRHFSKQHWSLQIILYKNDASALSTSQFFNSFSLFSAARSVGQAKGWLVFTVSSQAAANSAPQTRATYKELKELYWKHRQPPKWMKPFCYPFAIEFEMLKKTYSIFPVQ